MCRFSDRMTICPLFFRLSQLLLRVDRGGGGVGVDELAFPELGVAANAGLLIPEGGAGRA